MVEPVPPVLRAAPPARASWDFEQFLRHGIARAQAVSGDVWTDYNEHDPGVTILEQLCFALTDLAYRTDHPTADLLASVPAEGAGDGRRGAETAAVPPDVGFHSAAKLFSTSAITEKDLRRAVLGCFPEIWNVWLRPAVGETAQFASAFRVLLQKSYDPMDHRRGLTDRQLRDGVHRMLQSEACLGTAFLEPELLEAVALQVEADIALDPTEDSEPAAAVSRVLFAIDRVINPQPSMESYQDALERKRRPDKVFDGPLSPHGQIDLSAVPAWTEIPTEDDIRKALLHTQGIHSVSAVRLNNGQELPDNKVFFISLSPRGLADLRIRRGGATLLGGLRSVVDANSGMLAEVARRVTHRRRQYRYSGAALSGVRQAIVDLSAGEGVRRDRLGVYRSIQHLFPAIYGLGQYGASALETGNGTGGPKRHRFGSTRAEVNQLRAYLVLLEQSLSNYLAQLANMPKLLSWQEPWNQSYFLQPVPQVREDDTGRLVQEPPGSTDILLGAPHHESEQRLAVYTERLAAINRAADPVQDRAERAYDHLLARFNESFDNARLNNLASERPAGVHDVRAERNERKRLFLKEYERLGSRRAAAAGSLALGVYEGPPNETTPYSALLQSLDRPALADRLELLTGLAEGTLRLVDHGLLGADPLNDGVGEMMIWPPPEQRDRFQPSFRIGPAVWSFALSGGDNPERIDLLVNTEAAHRFCQAIVNGAVLVEVEPGRRGGRFGIRVLEERLGGQPVILAKSLGDVNAAMEAEWLAMRTAEALAQANDPAGTWEAPCGSNGFPARFHAHRLTAILSEEAGQSGEFRTFFETVFRREAPAHLLLNTFWLPKAAIQLVDDGLNELSLGDNGTRAARLRRLIAHHIAAEMFPDSAGGVPSGAAA